MSVRRAKILRDLTINKSRSLLIVTAVAVGVIAFGLMQIAGKVLQENLRDSFSTSRPAHSILTVSDFGDGLVRNVRGLLYVESAEARTMTQAWLETEPETWVGIEFNTIHDFNDWDINKVAVEEGTLYPPPAGTILLERSVRALTNIGDTVRIKSMDGDIYTLRIAGFVNDLSMLPTAMSLTAFGYMAPETAQMLGFSDEYNRLYVRTRGANNRTSIEKNITSVVKYLQKRGLTVASAPVPSPGKQILSDNVDSILLILVWIGNLIMLLSAFLVTAVMTAIMNQQVKQIGILKSLGAHTNQTMSLYFQQVILYGLFALFFAIPIASVGGYFMSTGVADSLNLIVSRFFVPSRTLALQAVSALLIPLVAALFPVISGSRITIREAISDFGSKNSTRLGSLTRIISFLGNLSQMANLSIRNTFRSPGRLALNFATLVLAGSMFIAVIGIRQSLQKVLVDIQNDRIYDVDVQFSKPHSRADLENKVGRVDEVTLIESWLISDGRIYIDDQWLSGSIILQGVPDETQTTDPILAFGRFLLPLDEYAIFVNANTLDLVPDLKPGSVIKLKIGTTEHDWTVVGIGPRGFGPVAYVHYDDLAAQTGLNGFTNSLVIQGSEGTPAAQAVFQGALLSEFDNSDYEISTSRTTAEIRESSAAQMDVLIVLLLFMVIFIALVGGLGLAITMSLNVMERTREIGILRSLGAKNNMVRRLVIVEGLVIGILSWVISIPVSVPLAILLGDALGITLLATPLDYIFSVPGVLLWLGLVIFISVVASLFPAKNAVELTIRDTLVYE